MKPGKALDRMVIRVDADATLGSGHLMRSIALGEAWNQLNREVTYVTASLPSELRKRPELSNSRIVDLRSSGDPVAEAEELASLTRSLAARWLVLDGYGFDPDYQKRLVGTVPGLLVVDDYGQYRGYRADVLLNQNIHASEECYRGSSVGRFLLGTRYVLLRQEFVDAGSSLGKPSENPITRPRTLLITLGGADPHDVTTKVLDGLALSKASDLEVTVVVGALNDRINSLRDRAALHRLEIQWARHSVRMAREMTKADLALTGAGSTCWELCHMGVAVMCISLAENQKPIAEGLGRSGAAVNLGWHEDVTPEAIAEGLDRVVEDKERVAHMKRIGHGLVDGKGALRVASILAAGG